MQINNDLLIKNNNIIYASNFKCKNLLDESNLSTSAKSVGIAYDGNKVYSTSPSTDNRGWNYNNANYYITLDAGTYTLSLNFIHKITNSSGGLFRFFKEDNTYIGNLNAYNVDNASITFTLVATTKLGFYFKLYDGQVNIQIESGNEETPYVKFKEFENKDVYTKAQLDANLLPMTMLKSLYIGDKDTVTFEVEKNRPYIFFNSHVFNREIVIITTFEGMVNIDRLTNTTELSSFTLNGNKLTIKGANRCRGRLYKLNYQVSA